LAGWGWLGFLHFTSQPPGRAKDPVLHLTMDAAEAGRTMISRDVRCMSRGWESPLWMNYPLDLRVSQFGEWSKWAVDWTLGARRIVFMRPGLCNGIASDCRSEGTESSFPRGCVFSHTTCDKRHDGLMMGWLQTFRRAKEAPGIVQRSVLAPRRHTGPESRYQAALSPPPEPSHECP
jgi:hypothetical protein